MLSLTPELAEFFGILFGDGYMNKYKDYHYLIEIAGHLEKDFEYHTCYIKKLMKLLFDIEPHLTLRKYQKTLYTRISSKKIFHILEEIGMPKGRKTNLMIPAWIKDNPEHFITFIKGFGSRSLDIKILHLL